jgi:hypothetical protein
MRVLALVFMVIASFSCASRPHGLTANQAVAASPTASLQSSSNIACTSDSECGVCYRAQTCGEPIAANDPAIEAPECHVTPPAFCMPRRGRCEHGHCVAR